MRAAIDVGTNTVRLLLGDVAAGKVEPYRYSRHITRLGGDYSDKEGLSTAAQERTLFALQDFADQCATLRVTDIMAAGTAAFRRAVNGDEFAARVRATTGIPLEIISGEQEATLTCSGVLSVIEPLPSSALLLDIGGGSTEFILMANGHVLWKKSYPLGVVGLCEEVSSRAEQVRVIQGCLTDVLTECRRFIAGGRPPTIVGTAGTVTTLAAMDMCMVDYDWRRVNNYQMSRVRLEQLLTAIEPMTVEARETLPGLEPGRGDLILPGIRIVLGTLAAFHSEGLVISDSGLLEGLLLAS